MIDLFAIGLTHGLLLLGLWRLLGRDALDADPAPDSTAADAGPSPAPTPRGEALVPSLAARQTPGLDTPGA